VAYRDIESTEQAGEATLALAWQRGNEIPAAQRFIEVVRSQAPL